MIEGVDNDYYMVENQFTGVHVTAFVEGEEDLVFWKEVFDTYLPNIKVDFGFNHRNDLVRGKKGLLKYKDKLGEAFILCIDSDWDFMLEEDYLDPDKNPLGKYILQTYVYSIENFKCYAENLNRLCIAAGYAIQTEKAFDFTVFFKEFSQVFYPLLQYIFYFRTQTDRTPSQLQRKNLEKTFRISDKTTLDIRENGQKIIEELQHKVAQIGKQLDQKFPDIDLEKIKPYFEKVSDIEESSYLWLIGHVLYEAVLTLLNRVVTEVSDDKIDTMKGKGKKYEANTSPPQVILDEVNKYKTMVKRNTHPSKKEDNSLYETRIASFLEMNHQRCLLHRNCSWMGQIGKDIHALFPEFLVGTENEKVNAKTDEANTKTKEVETDTEEAKTYTKDAETGAEEANTDTEKAETDTEEAKNKTDESGTKTDGAKD